MRTTSIAQAYRPTTAVFFPPATLLVTIDGTKTGALVAFAVLTVSQAHLWRFVGFDARNQDVGFQNRRLEIRESRV